MSGEPQYTQIRRPVSRVAEKVLGWLNWIGLLLLTVATMFIALVSFSNDTSIQKLEQTLTNNEFAQQVLTNNGLNTTQFVIWLQNGIWAVIVYLIVCLLISFLALISMNIRVLSGILFLIASIITLPLVLLLATVIIPVLFFIVAIMMFARKDRVETVPYYPGGYGPYDRDYGHDDYYERERGYHGGYEDAGRCPRHEPSYEKRDRELAEEEDDTRIYHPEKEAEEPAYAASNFKGDSENDRIDTQETDNPEEEPQFLSRQAKYKQKSADEVKEQQEMDQYEREQARIDEIEGNNEPEEVQNRVNEPRKGETPEEKAARKREKKERKKRAKALRKQRPSAVNQRRMNFEERRSFSQSKPEETEQPSNDNTTKDSIEEKADETKEEK
ncbi:DUF4064 domain-containing protein [Staphylococcus condimenti]|uniref:lipoteichoic acid stability factor AuxB n=1 Tax=Staphylococcus condimenti TaxID=70255 RepID=UPI00255183E7|nr:DUF4064 domain-containing protein [Staphylococcus condimenti]MDK8645736.1 DUF4064 domain-containing protein [Staphylococcus condimenti]